MSRAEQRRRCSYRNVERMLRFFGVYASVLVLLGRSSWSKKWSCDRRTFLFNRHRTLGYTLCYRTADRRSHACTRRFGSSFDPPQKKGTAGRVRALIRWVWHFVRWACWVLHLRLFLVFCGVFRVRICEAFRLIPACRRRHLLGHFSPLGYW